jgi:hypothetical protein
MEVLEQYCLPKKNEIIGIYKSFSRKQMSEEPFDQFLLIWNV